jgi:adenylate cyclase
MPPSDLPQEGQRKLAAIMAADVAGYSRLMADDERATVTALKEARTVFKDKVEARQGRLIDTAGDSVLAEFRSVVEAVECAVEVQAEIKALNEPVEDRRRMYFRIGVNLGDVIEEADATIYGDGVNIAARLEALAEPGGVNVSGKVYDEVKGKLDDIGFGFLGEQDVKNIPEPVRAYKVLAEGETATAEVRDGSKAVLRKPRVVVGLVAAVAVVIGIAVWGVTNHFEDPQMVTADGTPTDNLSLAMPTGPSIAVLPFDNMSGDPEQEYFADGLTEQVIAELARFRDLFVIARNSTFIYKEKATDVRAISKELGARYVLEGSVRRSPGSVRVTAQLLDGETGSHLWAETYERELTAENIFLIQDTIAEQVVATLASTSGIISRTERWQAKQSTTGNLEAYECVLLAHHFADTFIAETHLAARDCLEEAIKAEPEYVDAWAWLATIYNFGYGMGFNPGPDYLDLGFEAAQQAIRIDATSQMAHYAMALSHFVRHELDEFEEEAETAIALNPNNAEVLAELAEKIAFMGQWDRGAALMRKAMALNPTHPTWYWFSMVGYHIVKREYDEAVVAAQKINMPDFDSNHISLAIAYSHAGRQEDAEKAVASALRLSPDLTIETYSQLARRWNLERSYLALQVEALRKAGLPETSPEPPSRPVIAVLPFDNMSGDPEQEYFADGITEDIITRLAQFPDILVLGRNTTFQFKDQGVDIKTIAEKLEADYVVEGSIRRGGGTVRVTAQLLGAEDGTHLWAETFDRELDPGSLFEIQDEITTAIASRIGDPYGEIGQEEYRRSVRKAPKYVSSYDCVLRYFDYNFNLVLDTFFEARDCLKKAVEVEPDYAEALALLAALYIEEIAFSYDPKGDATFDEVLRLLEKATALNPRSGLVRAQLARGLYMTNDVNRAVLEVEEALRLAPNNMEVITIAAWILAYMGEYERSMAMMEDLAKMNPNYPPWMNWVPAYAHLARGENTEAIDLLEMTQMGWQDWTHAFIAAAHCLNGDIAEGQASLDVALEIDPELADTYWSETYFWQKGPGTRPLIDIVATGLEACGWEVPPDPGPEAFAPVQ